MKSMLCLLAFACLLSLEATAVALTPEFRASFDYYSPADDDTWDKGLGFEAQMAFWTSSQIGLAIAAGIAEWDAEEAAFGGYDWIYEMEYAASVDGDAQLIPLGLSALFRPGLGKVELTIEAGIRYILVDSSIEASFTAGDHYHDLFAVDGQVDIDDSIVGRISGDLGFNVSEMVKLFAGIGYQVDLSEGDMSWAGENIGEAEFESFFVRLGVGFEF